MVTNTMSGPSPLSRMNTKELERRLTEAQGQKKWQEATNITTELERRETPNLSFAETYEEKHNKIKEKVLAGNATGDELRDFFSEDIKKYRGSIKTPDTYKQKKIDELQQQLKDVMKQSTSLKEMLSPARMRLDSIRNKMEEFKNDTDNYPKNVLIYAMSITKLKVFGARQMIKRGFTTLARKRKSENMQENIENLEEILQIDEDDNATRKVLKTTIAEYVHDAKMRYVEDIRKQVGV